MQLHRFSRSLARAPSSCRPLRTPRRAPPTAPAQGAGRIRRRAHRDGAAARASSPSRRTATSSSARTATRSTSCPTREKNAGEARRFATFDDRPMASVLLDGDALYAGGQFGVYRLPYRAGDRAARGTPQKIASVRPGGGSGHSTTTLALSKGTLYASVGSSCNACDETDPTRATVQAMTPDGKNMHARAVDIRNAIALARAARQRRRVGGRRRAATISRTATRTRSSTTSARTPGTPDYGWLKCYDDRKPIGGASCANVVVPKVVFPAYDTPIGAAFYPADQQGRVRVSGELPRRRVRRAARLVAPAAGPAARRVRRRSRTASPPRPSTGRIRTRSGPSSSAAARPPTARARAARPASRSAPTARCSSAKTAPARSTASGPKR